MTRPNFTPEEREEINTIDCLSSALSDGMQALTAANLARPIKNFAESPDGTSMPENLTDVAPFVDAFLQWQLDRLKRPAQQALWSSAKAHHDATLYVQRKTWESKIKRRDGVQVPPLRVLAATVQLHKDYRADVHEALNHAAKHNEDVKLLKQEMVDRLDEVVLARMRETTEAIAGAVLTSMPALREALTQKVLSHDE